MISMNYYKLILPITLSLSLFACSDKEEVSKAEPVEFNLKENVTVKEIPIEEVVVDEEQRELDYLKFINNLYYIELNPNMDEVLAWHLALQASLEQENTNPNMEELAKITKKMEKTYSQLVNYDGGVPQKYEKINKTARDACLKFMESQRLLQEGLGEDNYEDNQIEEGLQAMTDASLLVIETEKQITIAIDDLE